MKESRIRGLTAEELEAVAGGIKNGWATISITIDGPGNGHNDFSTSTSAPFGQLKKSL